MVKNKGGRAAVPRLFGGAGMEDPQYLLQYFEGPQGSSRRWGVFGKEGNAALGIVFVHGRRRNPIAM